MRFEAQLSDPLPRQMREHAERSWPNEACGLLVGVGKKAHFLACQNMASNPREHFVIGPTDYARAEDMGEVLAVWHSHPDGVPEPSEPDLAGIETTELPWFISSISKTGDAFSHQGPNLFNPTGFQADYVGRPYIFGIYDCYQLVVDYYAREYGIALDPFHNLRLERWWTMGHDFFGAHFESQGFVEITDKDYREGDLLLFAVDSAVPNHVALYVTGDIILHHMITRLSRRETCGSFWNSKITHHLRHKTRC